jgi:hypothetical protein
MSSAQGPRIAGMEASANDAGGRHINSMFAVARKGGRIMSSDQGPRTAGMEASANDAGGRHMNIFNTTGEAEAES